MKTDCQQKDLRLVWAMLLGLCLLAARLILCSAQRVYLWPQGSGLDDTLMFNLAQNIANGEWLGPYHWMTLAKHSFFALWLAILHWLHIPYLLGGQLLWAAASLAAAFAVRPVLKKRWHSLCLFGILLFSPSAVANPAPYAFVLRVYRDNIFPALCLLCVAEVAGFALRHMQKATRTLPWAVLAGAALAACRLTREDGWWLLPFVVVGAVVTLIILLRSKGKLLLRRCLVLLLPFVVLASAETAWRGMNYAYYGRFIVSDFSSGEFADAYGAMTRIEHENWNPQVDVPKDVREKLYHYVPAFAELEPYLENPSFMANFASGDYNSGVFYWALRLAAGEAGYYDSPQKAQQYFQALAQDINALCDEGILPAGPQRSSVNPPIKAAYVPPVIKEGLYSLWFCATFKQCSPLPMVSPNTANAALYNSSIAPMEEFLHEKVQPVSPDGQTPLYSTFQNICFGLLHALRWCYAILLPFALLFAFLWQCWRALRFVLHPTGRQPGGAIIWLLQLGLLACILLRVFMVAFVTVSSFGIGTYIMYLASVHPLMLYCGFIGTLHFFYTAKTNLRGRVAGKHEKIPAGQKQ